MNKKIAVPLIFLFSIVHSISYCQDLDEAQFDSTILESKPIFKINKNGDLIKDVNMIAHMRFALNNSFKNGKLENAQFKANDLRMEIIGKISDKIKIRFRDVYSRSAGDANTVDLLRRSIDLAFVEYEANKKLTLSAGKMFGDFGGFEIFYNPITMVVYNDWLANGDIFLSSLKSSYQINKLHRLSFQLSNSSSRNFDFNYGNTLDASVAKIPMGLTLNWNGSFANHRFNTKWSYSNFTITKGNYMNLLVMGNQFKSKNLTLEYDTKISDEDLDRTGIISSFLGNDFSNRVSHVTYIEHWLRMAYFITPSISFSAIGMVNSSYWKGNPDKSVLRTDLLRNSWTMTSSLEYHFKNHHNMKFFLSYIGRFDRYSKYAQSQFNLTNQNNSQIMLGLMSHFIVF